jgi:hypothetical protein
MSASIMAMNLAGFEHYVMGLLPGIKRQYDRGVNRDLSQQQWQDLFQRNVTAVLQQTYQEAFTQLQQMATEREDPQALAPGDDLTRQILKPFHILIDELIQYAVQKHRSSCALSNFPEEHNPSQAYIAQVLHDIDRDWSAFVSKVAALLAR